MLKKLSTWDGLGERLRDYRSQIGTLLTGAGVTTVISGQSQTEKYILIGDADTTMPLTGFTVEVDGDATINVQGSTPLVSSFFKLLMQLAGGTVGLLGAICTGKMNKNTTYRLTNGGATTPSIFAFSDSVDGAPVLAATKGINATSYDTFERFSVLLLTPSANLNNCEITFADGSTSTMTAVELDALFLTKWPAQTDGKLDPVVSAIFNGDQSIRKVKVNSTTAMTVCEVKLPDGYFQQKLAEAKRA